MVQDGEMIIDVVATILALTLLLSRPQIDLEPEGRVFVVIDLTGSSSEGRKSSPPRSFSTSYRAAASSFSLRNFLLRLFVEPEVPGF